jgi:hypothetical protein
LIAEFEVVGDGRLEEMTRSPLEEGEGGQLLSLLSFHSPVSLFERTNVRDQLENIDLIEK